MLVHKRLEIFRIITADPADVSELIQFIIELDLSNIPISSSSLIPKPIKNSENASISSFIILVLTEHKELFVIVFKLHIVLRFLRHPVKISLHINEQALFIRDPRADLFL